MIIRVSDFQSRDEIDFHASFHYRNRYGRVSVRMASVEFEEVFESDSSRKIKITPSFETVIHWHHDKTDEVVMSGSLPQCVRLANLMTDTEDEVRE